MLRTRVIPALLLHDESLVKTKKFDKFTYVGDPCNTVRIFNELEVDELFILDITASRDSRGPNFDLLRDIASECFMPVGYGGGIQSLAQAKSIFDIGLEKIILNSHAVNRPELITEIANQYGSQAVVASIDFKINLLGTPAVYTFSGRHNTHMDPVEWAKRAEEHGAGEILLTSIDLEGTWKGLDIEMTQQVSQAVSIPVIAHGGARSLENISEAVNKGSASAVALGSMVVFQKEDMGVLVNFPDKSELEAVLE